MAARRNTMRKIKDVLRLRLSGGLSIRQIRASTKISVAAIQKLLARADELGLTWPLAPKLDEAALARLFYPAAHAENTGRFVVPDWPALHLDLKRPGMTKQLAWEEYTARLPDRCYSDSQFCARYRGWRQTLQRSIKDSTALFSAWLRDWVMRRFRSAPFERLPAIKGAVRYCPATSRVRVCRRFGPNDHRKGPKR